jgi:beta-lactamase regulating signal transducer with metallopeptidase domain
MPTSLFELLLWNVVVATVLAIVVGTVCGLQLLRNRPGIVHTLWLLVLVKLITPPVIPVPILNHAAPTKFDLVAPERRADVFEPATSFPNTLLSGSVSKTADEPIPSAVETLQEKKAANRPVLQIRWQSSLVTVSVCGTLLMVIVGAFRFRRMTLVLRLAARGDDRLSKLARIAANQMTARSVPDVVVVDARVVPFLWVRFHRPIIVLPIKLVETMEDDQLVCILCHELAHFTRKDHWVNLFASLVVVVFWWHPIAWWARQQLRAVQEVCCDGLVLERQSDGRRCYAETLLQTLEYIQTCHPVRLNPALGFGDRASLRSRFQMIASLHVRPHIGWPSATLAVASVLVMLCIPVQGQPSAEKNQIISNDVKPPPETREQPAVVELKPNAEPAQWLFAKWQASARTDGKIPGALIGQLTRDIDTFVKQYPDNEKSPLLTTLRPRLDASHDWTQADAVALLNDITAISTAPVSWRELGLTFAEMQKFTKGQPLPEELKDADWGQPMENGLRAAWLLQPAAKEYAIGTVLKARVLFHNSGKQPVVFSTDRWHQWDQHKAHDANGVELRVAHAFVTGLTPSVTFRLAPDEYCEVVAAQFGIGAGASGHSVPAKVGDEISLSHVVDAATGWAAHVTSDNWKEIWNDSIARRVGREAPLPASTADREQLIRRVKLDVFGVPATAEEISAFVDDKTPQALSNLIARLQAKPRLQPWSGRIPTGETKLRVVAAEAKKQAADDVKPKNDANAPDGKHGANDGTATENETRIKPSLEKTGPNDQHLQTLIQRILQAHGGEKKLNKLQFAMTVKHSNGETQKYFVQPPKNFRWETTHPDRTGKRIVILFPEGRRWWMKEPNGDAKEFHLTGIEPVIEYWFDSVKFFGPRVVLRLADVDHRVSVTAAEAQIEGRAATGIEVTGPHFKGTMYFDNETSLLVQRTADSYSHTQGFVIYSDYKMFDGIPIAQKEHDGYANPAVTDFKVVEKLDPKLFEGP